MTLVSSLKKAYYTEKPVLVFILKLIILSCVWKTLFIVLNAGVLQVNSIGFKETLQISLLALMYEFFIIIFINGLFLILHQWIAFRSSVFVKVFAFFTAVLNAINLLLNSIDIFYFRFHLQRADADLLYVLYNPFDTGDAYYVGAFLLVILLFVFSIYFFYRWLIKLSAKIHGLPVTSVAIIFFTGLLISTGRSAILPAYPLAFIKSQLLPVVQNSFHNFIFSVYRRNEIRLPSTGYMSEEQRLKIFDYRVQQSSDKKKNIILFIMESIPEEYFNEAGKHKVKMPFIDSLVKQSTFYSNAFSYSHHSNKGIVAMLGGIPTLTELPLYHSKYVSIPVSGAGSVLKKYNYNSSFFIGDHYDDFGFAKCTNWLGFDKYYSMESIPGYKKMEKHPMGLHDEYVLDFMAEKLKGASKPFLAVNFNISTHFPNALPPSYTNEFPGSNKMPAQKSLEYYSQCIERFFNKVKEEPWYQNSVFIFCSDHWMYLDQQKAEADLVQSFRIPIFIFDPANPVGKKIGSPVSQLDVLNTILDYGGIKENVYSYGKSLLSAENNRNRVVFARENSFIYQAFDSSFVLIFDAMKGKTLNAFNYKKDHSRQHDLSNSNHPRIRDLEINMKAFLQAAAMHYQAKPASN